MHKPDRPPLSAPGALKEQVRSFWNEGACGEALYLSDSERAGYEAHAQRRYELEPYLPPFADCDSTRGQDVLEIGVGLGADHQRFAEAGARLVGIDLTERAVAFTRERLAQVGLSSRLQVGDAEQLSFEDASFDVVYSWGVLHHSPDTPRAVQEVWRVLRPGGTARVMIYHTWSLVGLMLWLRYALLSLQPWRGLAEVYAEHLESPGTKAYSVTEAQEMFAAFREVRIETVLTHGDLLTSEAGQRHRSWWLSLARRIWPRRLLQRLLPRAGLFMLIRATK